MSALPRKVWILIMGCKTEVFVPVLLVDGYGCVGGGEYFYCKKIGPQVVIKCK